MLDSGSLTYIYINTYAHISQSLKSRHAFVLSLDKPAKWKIKEVADHLRSRFELMVIRPIHMSTGVFFRGANSNGLYSLLSFLYPRGTTMVSTIFTNKGT